MKSALLLTVALAACSPEPRRAFPVGLQGPVSVRVESEAARLSLDVADQTPPGAAVASAAAPGSEIADVETTDSWFNLRFQAARAAAGGAAGFYFRPPKLPGARDILDYPEEWQAQARVLRELQAVRPVLERGRETGVPFPVPPGVEARAWSFGGRRYVVLVNASDADAAFEADDLAPWRALFEVRTDARQALNACAARRCLPSHRALWLEGRPL